MAKFQTLVTESGGRFTSTRRSLLQTICDFGQHFAAEDLPPALAARGQTVSLATIYRSLPLLERAGIVQRAPDSGPGEAGARWEHVWGKPHHDHLRCVACGAQVEFHYPAIEVLQQAVASQHGFTLTGHRLELQGLCPSCQSPQDGGGSQ